MTTNEDDTLSTRDKILEAALYLFSENGFHATTTKKIAQKAKVNEVTLFRLCNSKLELFHEILKLVQKAGFDPALLTAAPQDPLTAVRFVIEEWIRISDENPREFKVLIRAILDEVKGFEEGFVLPNILIVQEFLMEKIKTMQETGIMKKSISSDILSGFMIAQLLGINLGRMVITKHPFKHWDRKIISDNIINPLLET